MKISQKKKEAQHALNAQNNFQKHKACGSQEGCIRARLETGPYDRFNTSSPGRRTAVIHTGRGDRKISINKYLLAVAARLHRQTASIRVAFDLIDLVKVKQN